jgi:hypothetical protein
MASIFETTNLTYKAGVDRLIGIEHSTEKCREHVMDVLQQQQAETSSMDMTILASFLGYIHMDNKRKMYHRKVA